MNDIRRKATASEIARMQDLADEAVAHGATGFSTGLFYPTNAAADREEVAAVAQRFARRGGVYATHMRDEFDRILDSIDETLVTAADADIPVVVSHHKCLKPGKLGPNGRDAGRA